jgi:SulP family sulfate permease
MIQWKEIRLYARSRVDATVCGLTVFTVCFVGLEAGILVAIVTSVVFFVASASRVALDISRDGDTEHIAVRGNLFYASIDGLVGHLRAHPAMRTTLDLRAVPYCDAAAAAAIDMIQRERGQHGGRLDVVRGGAAGMAATA